MLEEGRISIRQFFILVFLFTIGSSILILPAGITAESKQDAWIASLASMGAGILLVLLLNAVDKCFAGFTFTEHCERSFGRWPGKIVGLLMFFFSFILGALVLRNLGDFVTTAIMPETPIQFVHLSFMIIIVMAIRLGLEVFARTAEVLMPWVVLLIFLVFLLIIAQMDVIRLQPVFEGGVKPLVRGTLQGIGTPYMELSLFLLILPYVKRSGNKAGKAFIIGTLFGGCILVLTTLLCILVLGADLTARQLYPAFTLAKKISIGDILERMEVLLAGGWFLTMFMKVTICFYASVLGLAQLLKLSDYRPITLPLAMIMIVLSIVAYPNITYFLKFVSETWLYFAATFGLLLPLAMLAAAKLRGSS